MGQSTHYRIFDFYFPLSESIYIYVPRAAKTVIISVGGSWWNLNKDLGGSFICWMRFAWKYQLPQYKGCSWLSQSLLKRSSLPSCSFVSFFSFMLHRTPLYSFCLPSVGWQAEHWSAHCLVFLPSFWEIILFWGVPGQHYRAGALIMRA